MKNQCVKFAGCQKCQTSYFEDFDFFFIKRNKMCYSCLEKENPAIAESELHLMLLLEENNALSY
jgi:hypothetical protein